MRDAIDEILADLSFSLRFYPLEHLFMGVVCFGAGLMCGAVIMRWALS